MLDLSNVIAECRRSYNAMQVAERRFDAAVEYRTQAAERVKNGRSQYDVLLEAQRRILEAQLQFVNAEAEYAIAIKNVHFERATFLDYHGIALSESESDPQAYEQYANRRIRMTKEINYAVHDPRISLASATSSTSSCGICGQTGCDCQANFANDNSVAPPIVSVADATAAKPEKPLMANGLGKNHEYAPANLPPGPNSSAASSPVAQPASTPVAPATENVLPAHGLGKPHAFQPNALPAPTGKAQMQAKIPIESNFAPLPTFGPPLPTGVVPYTPPPTYGPVFGEIITDSVVQPSAPIQPATPLEIMEPVAPPQTVAPTPQNGASVLDSSRRLPRPPTAGVGVGVATQNVGTGNSSRRRR